MAKQKLNFRDYLVDLKQPTQEEIKADMKKHTEDSKTITPARAGLKFHTPAEEDCGGENFELYNKDWFMSEHGDMCFAYFGYFIDAHRLGEGDWFLHLMGKKWFDANTFLPAYFEACERAGIKEVKVRISY
jgi:hypothetical protein